MKTKVRTRTNKRRAFFFDFFLIFFFIATKIFFHRGRKSFVKRVFHRFSTGRAESNLIFAVFHSPNCFFYEQKSNSLFKNLVPVIFKKSFRVSENLLFCEVKNGGRRGSRAIETRRRRGRAAAHFNN